MTKPTSLIGTLAVVIMALPQANADEPATKVSDPAEMTNLLTSGEHLAVLKSLKAEIEQHCTKVLER